MILALDVGSTGVKAVIVDERGYIICESYRPIQRFFPKPGWVEHDLNDIWKQCIAVCLEVLVSGRIDAKRLGGIGISIQRNTLAVWDANSGAALGPAISWSDNRTEKLCYDVDFSDTDREFFAVSGHKLSTSNVGLKLRWLLDRETELETDLVTGRVLWGTLDCWLLWNLTRGRVWATEYSHAATSGMFDLNKLQWSDRLIEFLRLSSIPFPQILPTITKFGKIDKDILRGDLPIVSIIGDQFASLFGQGCVHAGMVKCSLGTGGFLLVNTGSELRSFAKGMIPRICWFINGCATYAFEGIIFHTGTSLEWLVHRMGVTEKIEQSSKIAAGVDTHGLYLVPAFTGLASPYWDPRAKAIIVGLTLNTKPEHLVRASLEAVAFQVQDILEEAKNLLSSNQCELRLDGMMIENDMLMQFLADQLQINIAVSPSAKNRAAVGAAYLAGIYKGIWRDPEEVSGFWYPETVYKAKVSSSLVRKRYRGWREAVQRSRGLNINRDDRRNASTPLAGSSK